MDTTQIVLLSVVIVLTIFLVVLGLQVFFVLKDLRKTLQRANGLLDSAHDLVTEAKRPIETVGNLFTSITAGVGIAHLLKRVNGKDESKK